MARRGGALVWRLASSGLVHDRCAGDGRIAIAAARHAVHVSLLPMAAGIIARC